MFGSFIFSEADMFVVYILYSEKLQKYYVGQTNNLIDRLHRHNTGQSKYTSTGHPWLLVYQTTFPTRSEAMVLEKKIKKRGIARFIEDQKFRR